MIDEQWLPIPIDNRYEVSNYGRVKGIHGIILKQKIDKYGHPSVSNLGPTFKTVRTNSLVAMCFMPARPPKYRVKHIDGNYRNNRLENLKWGPPRDYANLHTKLSEHDVWLIRGSKEKSRELAKRFGVTQQTIDNVKYGRTWKELVSEEFALRQTRYGFKWGPLEVVRMTSDPKWGVIISLLTDGEEMEVRCTPKGKRMTAITHERHTPPSEPEIVIG